MPLSIYMKLDLGDTKPTTLRLRMAYPIVKRPESVFHDALVKMESLIFSAYIMILDYDVYFQVPNILGRPFLATGRSLIDMPKVKMNFRLKNEE